MRKLLFLLIALCVSTTLFAQLTLTFPNGGEVFVAGADTIITWEGIMAEDTISIEYSSDNGANWQILYDKSSNLKETWKNIIKVNSNECLVKVKQFNEAPSDAAVLTLYGHTGRVYSVSYSPDGSKLASGSGDSTIKIWDAESEEEIGTLVGHTGECFSVSYSPDGRRIASGSFDSTIKIWDVDTGAELRALAGHTGWVYSVSYSPDGSRIASGSRDSTIKIWDVDTGIEIIALSGHADRVYSVSYSPDGSQLVSASGDGTIKIWDVDTGAELRTLAGHTGTVMSVSYSPDGSQLVSASGDGTIKIWDVDTGAELRTLAGHTGTVMSVSYSPDGRSIASGSFDSTIKLWDVGTGVELRTLAGHTRSVMSVSYSPDGRRIVSGSDDKTIKIWDISEAIEQEDQSDNVFSIVIPEANAKEIDFGKRLVGSVTDSVVVDFVYNPGAYKNRIDSIYIRGEHAQAFSLIGGFPKYYIKSGAGHIAEFRFEPYFVGQHRAEIVIITQTDTLIQNIIGEGFAYAIDSLRLRAGDVSAYDNRIAFIPIIVDSVERVKLSGITAISADLQYNSTLLYPNVKYARTAISPTIGQITLSDLPLDQAEGDTLTTIIFKTGLGNAEGCDLVLLNPVLTGGSTPEIISEDGYFSLLGVCHEGGTRLFSESKIKSGLRAICPNPASNYISIEIGIIEKGYTEVAIYDVLGKKIKTVFAEEVVGLGERTISADLSEIGNGEYMLLFKSPTYVEQKAVMIWK